VYAIAMFVAPSESDGILQKLRSSKTTNEIRKFLAKQIAFGPSGSIGYDYDRYGFHDAGTFSSDGGSSSGSGGSDGGGDGGGEDGGGGD
jgi:hypothetical protein